MKILHKINDNEFVEIDYDRLFNTPIKDILKYIGLALLSMLLISLPFVIILLIAYFTVC